MPKTKNNAPSGSIETDLSAANIFELLVSDRRRLALQYLTQTVGAVHISELADQVALWEGEHTRERYERICTSLVHAHLPKLKEAGVVQYDADRETVAVQDTADQLRPYLKLAASTDGQ